MISAHFPQPSVGGNAIARGASSVLREPYRMWDDAIRLDNLDTEIVIVPSCGRILRYAPSDGGPNFLWENPKLDPLTSARINGRAKNGHRRLPDEWLNVGGDKAWPWPQSRWPQLLRRDWPPPRQLEREPHEAHVVSRHVVELTSQPLPEFGLRVLRKIALAPHGNRLTVTTTLDPLKPTARKTRTGSMTMPPPSLWAAWSIAQIKTPTRLAIRIDAKSDLPGGHKLLRRQAWEAVRRVGDDILLARCPTSHEAKFGADGDLIVAEIGDWLFVQKRIANQDEDAARTAETGRHLSGEAVQVYASGTAQDPAPGMDYCELEFTGRRGQPRPTLTVQWDLISWNPSTTDNEFAALVRTL